MVDSDRKNFGKLIDVIDPPDMIEIQTESYWSFLQLDVPPNRRKMRGCRRSSRKCSDREL